MVSYILRRLLQIVPVFFGATFLIFALVYAVPGDPIDALAGDKPATRAGWRSCFRPAIGLGWLSLCCVARLARASLVEAMRADYVRTARAKGLPERRVVGVHALRNSLIPVVTFLGVDLGSLLAGAI